jgi:transposase
MLKPERVLEFIGESPAIRVALDLMKQAAPTDAPVVILGESGTGKGLLARTLHHHAFLVSQQLAHLDYLDEVVDTVSAQIDEVIAPFAEAVERLDTIPGVNKRTAETVIAEIGVDMIVFPTDRHLASWAGLCPREQLERRKATRASDSALGARYRRVMRHRGHKKAIVAVAHAILITTYHLLSRGTTYREPGRDYYDRRHPERARHRAVQVLERQGYRVILEPAA